MEPALACGGVGKSAPSVAGKPPVGGTEPGASCVLVTGPFAVLGSTFEAVEASFCRTKASKAATRSLCCESGMVSRAQMSSPFT